MSKTRNTTLLTMALALTPLLSAGCYFRVTTPVFSGGFGRTASDGLDPGESLYQTVEWELENGEFDELQFDLKSLKSNGIKTSKSTDGKLHFRAMIFGEKKAEIAAYKAIVLASFLEKSTDRTKVISDSLLSYLCGYQQENGVITRVQGICLLNAVVELPEGCSTRITINNSLWTAPL